MNHIQFEKILAENGWMPIRTVGSCRQYRKCGCGKTVIVADRGSGNISADVLTKLEKTTGLSLRR